jgi:hypothetical protein
MEAIFQFVFGEIPALPPSIVFLTSFRPGKSIFAIIQEGNLSELMTFLDQYPQRLNVPNDVSETPNAR